MSLLGPLLWKTCSATSKIVKKGCSYYAKKSWKLGSFRAKRVLPVHLDLVCLGYCCLLGKKIHVFGVSWLGKTHVFCPSFALENNMCISLMLLLLHKEKKPCLFSFYCKSTKILLFSINDLQKYKNTKTHQEY